MENKFEIDIKRLILELVYKCWVMILAAIVFGAGAYVYAKTRLTPRYTASVSLYVNNYDSQLNSEIKKVSSSDLYTAQALVQTYLTFLSTDKVLDEVSQMLDEKYTSAEIRGMMNANVMNETEIFQVSITCTNPEEAAQIANIIADMAPAVITNYIEGSSVKVVDYAKVPNVRSFPVYRKYIMLGGIAGGGLAAAVIVLMFLFDTKVSNEEDIKKIFTAPVIGKIPNFEQRTVRSSSYGNYKYDYGYRTKDKKETKEPNKQNKNGRKDV